MKTNSLGCILAIKKTLEEAGYYVEDNYAKGIFKLKVKTPWLRRRFIVTLDLNGDILIEPYNATIRNLVDSLNLEPNMSFNEIRQYVLREVNKVESIEELDKLIEDLYYSVK